MPSWAHCPLDRREERRAEAEAGDDGHEGCGQAPAPQEGWPCSPPPSPPPLCCCSPSS